MMNIHNCETLRTIFSLALTLLLLSGLVNVVSGFKYGPSLTSLESPVLKLEDYPNYSVLLPLTKSKITAYPYELAQEDARWRDIKAIVKAPEGFRVMMVVQVLYLGLGYDTKLEKDVGLKGCIDSIQIFEQGDLIEEICGSVNYTDKSAHPKTLTGPRTFLSKGSSIIVGLQFANRLRQSTDSHSLHLEYRHKIDIWSRKFSLGIAFTAFKQCDEVPKEEKFHPCDSLSEEDESHFIGNCIRASLFCDGVMNCANDFDNNQTIGSDEDAHYCESLQNSNKNDEISSPINFKPQDRYVHGHDDTFTATNVGENHHSNNFHHTELTLGPSSTVLLIVLTILSVMILGVIVRLCCTKCVGSPHHAPRLSTASETASSGSVWTVSPSCSSRISYHSSNSVGRNANFLPSFIFHSQCSRFDPGKDLPPSYYDLFPEETPKSATGTELQMTSLPTSNNDDSNVTNIIISDDNINSSANLIEETVLENLDNNNEPKLAENSIPENTRNC